MPAFVCGIAAFVFLFVSSNLQAQCTNVTTYANLESCFSSGTLAITITSNITLTGNITLVNNTSYTLFTNGSDIIRNGFAFSGGNGNTDIGVIINGGATKTITGNNSGAYTMNNLNTAYSMLSMLGVLPIEFKGFKVTQNGTRHLLVWETISEKNTTAFDIESAVDGIHFSSIGTVKANGLGSNYTFSQNTNEERTYYRLKMTDLDGSVTYSTIVSAVANKQLGKLKVYPNPVGADGALTVETGGAFQNIFISNALGQVVLTANTAQINTSALSSGLYYLTVKTDTETMTQKFLKQ